jgi:hypothetical protein
VILLVLPAYWLFMRWSLWLDEAFVANAALAKSTGGALYYKDWMQSTSPRLLLLLIRACSFLLTPGEVSLRLVPWTFGILALVCWAVLVRRIFAIPVSLVAMTLLATNYWAIKYAQQVKQYSTDLFVSASVMLLLYQVVLFGKKPPRIATVAVPLSLAGFLSYPAVFWFPTAVIAVALGSETSSDTSPQAWVNRQYRAIFVATILGLSSAINYLWFIKPNITPDLFYFWEIGYLGGNLTKTVPLFLFNLGDLLLPAITSWTKAISFVLEVVMAVGGVRCIVGIRKRDRRAVTVLLLGLAPIFSGCVVSMVKLYPLNAYPRVIVWMLPSCYLLIGYALEMPLIWLWNRSTAVSSRLLLRACVVAACCLVALASAPVLSKFTRLTEDNRELFAHLAAKMQAADCVYVHAGVAEQFSIYRRLLHWSPSCVYQGNIDWACCGKSREIRASDPTAGNMREDLDKAVTKAQSGKLWLVLPSGLHGHWSVAIRPHLAAVPSIMAANGCRVEEMRLYGFVELTAYQCVPRVKR